MKFKFAPWMAIVAVLIIFLLTSVGYYNNFVRQRNQVEAQWQQVEVQYQRRFDLIPNLVEATKGIQQQEQKVFGDIAAARANYAGASSQEQKVAAANQVEGSLARLLVVVENYPQLKSDQAIARLQDELAGSENRIAVERRRYNDDVKNYNNATQVFPGNLYAGLFGFKIKPYFESAQSADQAPKVDFSS